MSILYHPFVQRGISFIIPIENSPKQFAISSAGKIFIIEWNGISEKANLLRTAVEIVPSEKINDGKLDIVGRLYCDIVPVKDRHHEAFIHQFLSEIGIGISSGLTWNINTNKFYFVDSLTHDVKEHDYNPETGELSI